MGEGRGVYRVLVGKPEGKRPLGKARRGSEDIIQIHLQEVGCAGMDCIELAQKKKAEKHCVCRLLCLVVDRAQCRAFAYGNKPSISIKCGQFFDQLGEYQVP
jgi:hypothetical protein